MSKLIISNLNYHYAKYYNPVFEGVNLNLDTDWKLGLIGRNGRGKTTFLKLLTGELAPTLGNIYCDVHMEYFPYVVNCNYTNTLDVMKENIACLKSLELHMDEIILSEDTARYEEYSRLLEQYQTADGFPMENWIRRELNAMHLKESLLDRDYSTLSGGEKTKIQIIILFLRTKSYVLLDEPTNHLDIEGKCILADYLKHKKGFIVVSHDRDFLDQVIDHVLSINKTDIELEKGTYSSWKANKDKKEVFEFRARTRLVKEIKSLEKQSTVKREWAGTAEKTKNQHSKFERSSGSRAAQFMMHAKNAEENAKKSLDEKNLLLLNYETAQELTIQQNASEYDQLITVKELTFGYASQLLFQKLTFQIGKGDRLWIKGKNGCGKSTLIKLLTNQIPSEHIEFCRELRISQVYQEPLWSSGYLKDHIEASEALEKLTQLCDYFDISAETLGRPLETYSGGELRKIDIARALCSDNQLLIMDEPLNYMDVYFREQLEKAILEYQPTLVFVEHDERFGRNIATAAISLQ